MQFDWAGWIRLGFDWHILIGFIRLWVWHWIFVGGGIGAEGFGWDFGFGLRVNFYFWLVFYGGGLGEDFLLLCIGICNFNGY
jgi:hypothetical protein